MKTSPESDVAVLSELAVRVARLAETRGCEAAEVRAISGRDLSVRLRDGASRTLETAEHRKITVRLFRAGHVALGDTTDLSSPGLLALVDDTLAAAELSEAPSKPPVVVSGRPVDAALLDLHDASLDTLEDFDLVEVARSLEAGVRSIGACRPEEAAVSASLASFALVLPNGFCGGYTATVSALRVAALADQSEHRRQRAQVAAVARHRADLPLPETLGARAATRALAKRGARPIASCEVPVVFHPEIAAELVELFVMTLLGTTFRASDTRVASPSVTLVDDPLLPRGLGSRPFDGEGAASETHRLVVAGQLETVLCDAATARERGRRPTASARRTPSGGVEIAASNVSLLPTATRAEDILRSTARGLYVTETLGHGFDPFTRHFSRAVCGTWIERGELTFPVSEVVLSLDLHELFRRVDAVGDDPQRSQTITAPTLRVERVPLTGRGV
jgi:PmbA protein